MTCLRLPGGTDAAEMALFDVDALSQSRPPMGEGLDELVTRARLVRLPTGGDGGYLLHLYVDERVPELILQYCLSEDKLTGQFATSEGRIAFGGVESTFKEFQPNRLIRSDGTIAPGSYCFTAYRTDIPDEVVSKVANVASTSAERWLDRAPRIATLATLALTVACLVLKTFIAAGVILVVGYLCFKAFKRLPGQGALAVRRDEAQLDLPSIVIEMVSGSASKDDVRIP